MLETFELSEVFDRPKSTKRYKKSGMFFYAVGYFTSGRTHLNVQGSIYPVIISHEIHQRMFLVIDTSQIVEIL